MLLLFPSSPLDLLNPGLDSESESANTKLKNLSLVRKAFVPFCRPHIFKSVDILFDYGRSFPSLTELSGLIEKNPLLATYITRVSCKFESPSSKSKDALSLPTLFNLPNVQEFEIQKDGAGLDESDTLYYTDSDRALTWRKIFDHFIKRNLSKISISGMWNPPIFQLFSSPSLKTIELKGCMMQDTISLSAHPIPPNGFNVTRFVGSDLTGFPLSILSCCPRLEELDVVQIEPATGFSSLPEGQSFVPFRHLRSFTSNGDFDCSILCDSARASGLDIFPSLKELSISPVSEDEVPGVNTMFRFARSLNKLYFAVSLDCPKSGSVRVWALFGRTRT
ncbi:hypothetical protein CVT24_002206 [Panaeolus cyanescens]|uniref:F-box domain-containing protein n=1 Tax=Panaeolus cyanescens TaxID=181874 RepID=A0A409X4U1_9AGAR|nr:hypothetical protein CVT24_002206 [Panaeolus cyanescens]